MGQATRHIGRMGRTSAPRPYLINGRYSVTDPPKEVAKSVRVEGYSVGKLLKFEISHPDHGTVTVGAVNETAAIVAAAAAWGVRWQPYAFYAYCKVRRAAV